MCLASSTHAQEVQFRAVGGPGLERGEAVVPHATGAFLVCNSKLPEVDLVRGYLVHYDSELNVDWTRLLPCQSLRQEVVNAWSESSGEVTVLTRELSWDSEFSTQLHRLDSTGVWHESTVLDAPSQFQPVAHVSWLGGEWIVGQVGSQPTAVNVATGETKSWGGSPGVLDQVTDATVFDNLLVTVGSRTENDTTRTAVWALYPLGQLAFESLGADTAAGDWSEANAVATNGQSLRVLHSYRPTDDNDPSTLHSILSINPTTGALNGTLYGPSEGQRPGRDLTWTPQGWVKLTKTDGFVELDQSMLITHYNASGGYVSQGAWGTNLEDDPSHVTLGPNGSIWVAGSTRGAIDPSWNACLFRLDSLGPLDSWAGDLYGIGLHNDSPLFEEALSVEAPSERGTWSVSPNPASDRTRISGPTVQTSGNLEGLSWTLIDSRGQTVRNGRGQEVDLRGLTSGTHVIHIRHQGQDVHVRLLVVGLE